MPSAWGHTRLLETDWRLITQESHCFSCGSVKEENRWAYFIKVEGNLSGFVMVITLPEVHDRETDFQMAEFFVLHKYRRKGIGYEAFRLAADMHRGKWQLKLHPGNIPSVHFWEKSISRLTEGDYELVKAYPGTDYEDGTPGDVYFFES